MTRFAGLDVSVRETAVCVVDEAGKVLAERKVATEPDDLIELLRSISSEYGRIGFASRTGLATNDDRCSDARTMDVVEHIARG